MSVNATGIDVSGSNNPNWRGGLLHKVCEACGSHYAVKRAQIRSRFCSLQCVGVSQRKAVRQWVMVEKVCEVCGAVFAVPRAHNGRYHCCSRSCSHKRRAQIMAGDGNPNWNGGISRLPYPWNFKQISKRVIERDGCVCQNPKCSGADKRLTTHHINYDKADRRDQNLITLCSVCNSKANFGRAKWQAFYGGIMAKKRGGGWITEEF